ncbi:MAG: ArnT family glycosyltransferase [Thermoflexales bacterium]
MDAPRTSHPSAAATLHWPLLALVLLIGAALRFYAIGELPPGLYRDEAFYGLDALNVLRGELAVYFVANNGREGMFIYLLAASVGVLGNIPLALRFVSAFVGVITLAAIYSMGRAMFSPRVGLLAAAILASTFWHVALSRVAFRAILLPLWLALAAALLFATLRSPGRVAFALGAGTAIGLTAHTYASAQALPLLLIAWGATAWRTWRSPLHRRALCWMLGMIIVTTAPLALWIALHGALYFNRAGQVSIFNPAIGGSNPLSALWRNALKVAGMFFVEGDRIWRHNLALRPVFDPLIAVSFVVGLTTSLGQWRHSPAARFALLGLGVFAIPTLLAEDAPHFLRAIGMLPFACLLAARGLDVLLTRAEQRLARHRSAVGAAAFMMLATSAGLTTQQYFHAYIRATDTAHWFESHNVALAQMTRQALSAGMHVVLDKRLSNDNPTLRFMTPALDSAADYRDHLRLGDPNSPRQRLIADPNHAWSDLLHLPSSAAQLHLQLGPTAQDDRDSQPRRAFIALDITPTDAVKLSPLATFDQRIALLQAVLRPMAKGHVAAQLLWTAREPIREDFAVFVHWMRDGQLIAQADSSPGHGFLPMPRWRPGDYIVDEHFVQLPGGVKPGDHVRIGVYRRESNQRLTREDGSDFVILRP